jgi:hypothetical protein
LGGPLPKLCPAFQNTDQDGRQLSSAVGAILIEGPNAGHIFGREPSNDYFIYILFLLTLEIHFFVDSLLLVTQIIKGKQLYYKM